MTRLKSGFRLLWQATVIAAFSAAMPQGTTAQEFRALARVLPADSRVALGSAGVELVLALSQAVPYRVATMDAPRRLVMDFREVAFDGLDTAALGGGALRVGRLKPGWSRLVLDLPAPLALVSAGMTTDPATGGASIHVVMEPTDAAAFAAAATAAEPGDPWAVPRSAAPAVEPARPRGPLVVVLDPGHGGVDPGAQRDGLDEADLMLTFARELKEKLVRDGGMQVHLTREADDFVSLQARVTLAREKGADVFLSLHADALAQGRASGTTIYTLSDRASDRASELLAERLDRADLLAGVDLQEQDDLIAGVLMDMVRLETQPRSDLLADHLVEGIRASAQHLHKRPRLEAGFSVLRAPDIPSALIELGFMSDEEDLERLTDPAWRARLIEGILKALQGWAAQDAATLDLMRQ